MESDVGRRRILLFEVGVVLTLFWLPATSSGAIDYVWPRYHRLEVSWVDDIGRLIHYMAVITPVLFIAWASGDRAETFGLKIVWWKVLPISLAALLGSLIFHRYVP